jgi:hypothetical protein
MFLEKIDFLGFFDIFYVGGLGNFFFAQFHRESIPRIDKFFLERPHPFGFITLYLHCCAVCRKPNRMLQPTLSSLL